MTTNKEKTPQNSEVKKSVGQKDMPRTGIFLKLLLIFITFSVIPLALFVVLLMAAYRELFFQYAEVVQSVSQEEFEALTTRLQDITTQGIITFGVFVILIIFVSFLASRSLVNPIKKLVKGSKKISSGDFDYRVNVNTGDEIGDLAESFNDMAEKIQENYEREKNISDMKSEFISVTAHQLRTPLSAVKWTFEMLLSGDLGDVPEEQKEFIKRGAETNERMVTLINDLLNVSRIEEGKFGFEFDKSSIVDIVESVIEEERVRAEKNHLKLEFNKPKHSIPEINMDSQKIRMVIANLVDNAIKYSLEGGSIEVNMKKEGKFVQISVSDEGIGISKEQLSKLFTKFFRAENAVRLETSGSGLGLFIVKNIIKRHGGDVWAESEEGEGTTFYFTLPVEDSLIPSEEKFESFMSGF